MAKKMSSWPKIDKNHVFLSKITFKSFPLKPLNQITPNLAGMVLGWVPFKIVSDSPALHSTIDNLRLVFPRNIYNIIVPFFTTV